MYRLHSVFPYIAQICALFLLILCSDKGFGATVSERGGLQPITLSNGLSDLLVNQIYKDNSGFVWFGTESSVDRFDGYQILRFPIPGEKHKSKRVLCFWESPDHTLFVGTNQGLFSIGTGDSKLNKIAPTKLNFPINSLCGGPDNQLFIGSKSGLYIYNIKNGSLKHKFLDEDNLSEKNNIKGLFYGGDSDLWILTPHRLWKMNLQKNSLTAFTLPVAEESTVLCSLQGKIFIGTNGNGVVTFDTSSMKFETTINVGNDIVTALTSAPGDELIIGTDGDGVYFYSVEEGLITEHLTASVESSMQLRSNSVYSVLKDDKGILWIGYYQSGVDYSPKSKYMPEVVKLPAALGVNQEMIRSLEKGEGYTVVGTHEGVILIEDATGKAKKFSTPEIASNLILAIKYFNGVFYIGTYHGGLYRLDPAKEKIERYGPKDLETISVFEIQNDKNNHLWIATSEGLIRIKDPSESDYEIFNSKNSQLPAGNVYEIFFDSLGRGWIATENGMAIWNGQYIQTTGFPEGFINKMKIRVIYEDKDHQLYFAPDRGVLWTSDLSLQNFHQLEESDEERFSQITFVVEDQDGWMWIGTDKGLISFNKKSPTHFMVYNYIGGVTNPIYTLAHPYEAPNGDFLFGSTTGIHKVDFNEVRKERVSIEKPILIISDIQSGGKSLATLKETGPGEYSVLLDSDQKDLQLFVTDLNYMFKDYFELEYKVFQEGVENEWKWVSGGEPIAFNELPKDNFILNVKFAGVPESQINIKVKRHHPFPWWWIAGGVLILLLILSTTYYFRHKRTLAKMLATSNAGAVESDKQKPLTYEEPKESEDTKTPYKTTRLTDEECKRLLKKLDNLMKTKKPYINPDLKIKDLAAMIDANSHSLSFLFNQYLEKSYYDYVNSYRVEEFKTLVKETDISKYTLTSLAEKCGFSSRASFFRHFKTLTGMTPAEYLKKV